MGQPFKSGRAKTSVAPRSLVDEAEAEGRSGECLGKLGKLGPARLLQTGTTQSLLCVRAAFNGKDLVSSRESALHQGKEGRIYY